MSSGSVRCARSHSILTRASQPNELERMTNSLMVLIKTAVSPNAQFVRSPEAMWLTLVSRGGDRKFSAERTVELEEVDLRENWPEVQNRPLGSIYGLYHPSGKIFLVKHRWCVKTLVHETLHSASITAARTELRRRYYTLFEGLTEFYCGYLLSKHYPKCYESWKGEIFKACSMRVQYYPHLWGAMCKFISIQHLGEIYFWRGRSDWETLFEDFVNNIRKEGYPRFRNILQTSGQLPFVQYLRDECIRNFCDKFKRMYESVTEALDFSSMEK